MKKLIAILTVLILVLGMATMAYADGNDGTITLTNAAVGAEYKAYKILDATYDGDNIAYTTTNYALFSAAGSPWTVSDVADANGNYNVQLAAGKTIGDVNTWITANLASFTPIAPTVGYDTVNDQASDDTLQWTGLAYGYYYITSGLGTVVTIDSVKPAATVVDKNETNPTNLDKSSDTANAQIDDLVQFTVTFTATNYITDKTTGADGKVTATTAQVTNYHVLDTANGFDYVVDATHPVTVQVGSRSPLTVTPTVVQQVGEADAADYGTMEFDIAWADASGNPLYNYTEDVTIIYYGRPNEFADDGNAENTVLLTNNLNLDPLTDSTETLLNDLTINKTDGANALTGAKFELYRNGESNAATPGTIVTLIDITSTIASPAAATRYYRVAEGAEAADAATSGATTTIDMTEGSYSSVVIYGLDGDDTYYIKEIEAPRGYNKLDAEPGHTWVNQTGDTETIVNNAGAVLPSTGGIGTTIFYIVGGLLVAGAVVLLITKRRMSKEV